MNDPFEDVDLPTQRREARERAISLLYEAEMKSMTIDEVIEGLPLGIDDLVGGLVKGVTDHESALDDSVAAALDPAWSMARLAVLERIILRLGTYELSHRPDVPTGAILNEAVDLAKHFSGPEAARFVNGVLSTVAKSHRSSA